jgi:hypothetical protein
MNATGDSDMEQKQINDHGVIPEAPRFVSGADDDQDPHTCMAIISMDGEQRRCKAKPIMGDRFCYHHSDRISPELEKLHNLLKGHQGDFFNEDVRLKAEKLLRGFRPRTKVDREFAAKLAAHWKKVRRQRPRR